MKTIHLIANAHLDPMWLWRWQEGCTEALSTFRTAEECINEYPGFVFNHNEALLYEWVKEYEPDLFARIQKQVADGKWHIMGGWYLQPDCNMCAGESMIRNISLGRRFFSENFGVRPKTALNFDSFGHSVGMVQILEQAGFDSYVCCRDGSGRYPFNDSDFVWKGFNGTSVIMHRAREFYSSGLGNAGGKLERFLQDAGNEPVSMMLWGVGDHGGGPTRKDLDDLSKIMEDNKENYVIIHSTFEDYFNELRELKTEFPTYDKSLNPVCPGVYTSQIRVKQRHRELENALYSGEKMATAASLLYGREYPRKVFDEAVRALVFSEFHDGLPGSGIQPVEEDVLRMLDYGLLLMDRERLSSAIALSAGQEKIKKDSTCILIYNPHPYRVTGQMSFEMGPPEVRDHSKFYNPRAYLNGKEVPTQCEEALCGGPGWRKKVVIEADLDPSAINRVDVYFDALDERPARVAIEQPNAFVFDNGEMRIVINSETGLMDSYQVNGKEYLQKDAFHLTAIDDSADSWEIRHKERFNRYPFALLTEYEGSEFSGLARRVGPSVRVIEDGEVRTVVEALFGWHDSKAYQRYILPKKGTSFEIETGVYWNERNRLLKLEIPTALTKGEYSGQVMFGHETLFGEGRESVAQKWTALTEDNSMLAVFNQGNHGSSEKDGTIGLTLLRSAGYAGNDASSRSHCYTEMRYYPRMDQGERIFHFKIEAGDAQALTPVLDQKAQAYSEAPYIFMLAPSGQGEKKDAFITISNPSVLLSAFKQAEDGNGYTLRLYECAGSVSEATVTISSLGISENVTLQPFEIRTLHLDEKARTLQTADILD